MAIKQTLKDDKERHKLLCASQLYQADAAKTCVHNLADRGFFLNYIHFKVFKTI